ncbi:MAG: exodeoxyribonuclease VII small subunit [Planctomycetaceae bacterium]|jgi:exodeoxyribonuclease VII small subunit|nr:exodeoxyribonuclease VII small subunit [Planctomycetaceae bacterium]
MTQENQKFSCNEDFSDLPFEAVLARLEQIVRSLDAEQVNLETALQNYETGIKLLRQCYATLQNAERRIEILKKVNADGTFETEKLTENQFLSDAARPGQHRTNDVVVGTSDNKPSSAVRRKRVRKINFESSESEENEIPFDFD